MFNKKIFDVNSLINKFDFINNKVNKDNNFNYNYNVKESDNSNSYIKSSEQIYIKNAVGIYKVLIYLCIYTLLFYFLYNMLHRLVCKVFKSVFYDYLSINNDNDNENKTNTVRTEQYEIVNKVDNLT